MGVAPTVLWGRRRQAVTIDGLTRHDPDWLQIDYALLVALEQWEQTEKCICGQPRSSHRGKTAKDYAAAYITCPAFQALDAQQVSTAKADGESHVKPDPGASRGWFTTPFEVMQALAAQDAAEAQVELHSD